MGNRSGVRIITNTKAKNPYSFRQGGCFGNRRFMEVKDPGGTVRVIGIDRQGKEMRQMAKAMRRYMGHSLPFTTPGSPLKGAEKGKKTGLKGLWPSHSGKAGGHTNTAPTTQNHATGPKKGLFGPVKGLFQRVTSRRGA